MSDDQESRTHVAALLLKGAHTAQRLNDVVQEAEDLKELDVEILIIGSIMYSAGYARHDGLDLDGFLALCAAAFQDVVLTPTRSQIVKLPPGVKPS